MTVKFTMEKATKNTIRFTEIRESDLDASKVGTVYVPKATLKELGWSEGKVLTVDLNVE